MTTFGEALRSARRVKDTVLRSERVGALGAFDDPRAVEAVAAFLDPGEAVVVRTAAAAALGAIGGPAAVDTLIGCLADPWYDVRCKAAKGLAALGDRRATAPLHRALAEERDGYAIAAMVEALGPLGDGDSAELLLAHAARYPGRVEAALTEIGGPAVEALIRGLLEGEEAEARRVSAAALGRIGDARGVDPLRQVVARSRDITLLTAAARALRALGVEGKTPRLRRLMLVAAGEWEALVALGRASLPELVHALRHRERDVRAGAAEALSEIGDREAVPALVRCFQAWVGKDRQTQQAAARALGRLGDARAVDPLIAFIARDEPALYDEPRQIEIEALGQIGDERAVGALIEVALGKRFVARRREAIRGLGAWRKAEVVAALRELLSDPDLEVRLSAAQGLDRQGWVPESPAERAALLAAARQWDALIEAGEEGVPWLVEALDREPERVQSEAARALGRIGSPRAAEAVLDWLFAHPVLIVHSEACAGWIEDLRPLLGDYARLAVHAACTAIQETDVLRDTMSVTELAYTYDLSDGDRAIGELAAMGSAPAVQLLRRVAAKPDATVDVGYSENEWGSGTSPGTLSFAAQREMARRALDDIARTASTPPP